MKQLLLLTALFFSLFTLSAQPFTLSENATVSVLTVGPGDNLYDKFGHNAIRIKDEASGYDAAYNFGVYDFDTPNFYGKFAQGKLNYKLEVWKFDSFLNLYKRQNRWVKEQVLDLNYSERKQLFEFLENNALPENRYYLYDFFYDNCATKIRDVLVAVLGDKIEYRSELDQEQLTFRQLIQKNVYYNSWSSLGMDVAIGAVVDQKASSWQYQFLPEYVFKAQQGAYVNRSSEKIPLVKSSAILNEAPGRPPKGGFIGSPLFVFLLIALIILFITYKDWKSQKRTAVLDASIFLFTGLIGVFLSLLWFATDHTSTVFNYNLLWAFPFSILFFLHIKKKEPKAWIRRYVIFLLICLSLMAFHWITGVQQFPLSILPLVIALAIRFIYLNGHLKAN